MATAKCMYVVFPGGRNPTPAQFHFLNEYRRKIDPPLAIGYDIDTRRPAIRFDRDTFVRLRQEDLQFESLIAAWEQHGCLVLYKLHFMEDATTLSEPVDEPNELPVAPLIKRRPASESPSTPVPDFADVVSERREPVESVERKHARAQESQAVVRLHTLEKVMQAEAIGNFARLVPGLLALGIFVLILVAGVLLYNKVSNSSMEPRRDTIERMSKEPVKRGARNSERGTE